jgi:hypothetical protein
VLAWAVLAWAVLVEIQNGRHALCTLASEMGTLNSGICNQDLLPSRSRLGLSFLLSYPFFSHHTFCASRTLGTREQGYALTTNVAQPKVVSPT